MAKRRDFLESLSQNDPNYRVGKHFYLKSWADSNGLVADAFSGGLSIVDFVEGCVKSFEHGAQALVEFQDGTTAPAKCREIDKAAKALIREFGRGFKPESKRLGKTNVTRAIEEVSRRVTIIAARAKQQILEGALDRDGQWSPTAAPQGTANCGISYTQPGETNELAATKSQADVETTTPNTTQSPVPPRPSESHPALRAQGQQGHRNGHVLKKPVRRNPRYEQIDRALRDISAARPKNHEEVFKFLDDRKVAIPNRKSFKVAGGWLKGFQQSRPAASTWLSQAWGRLGLPAFARGPKK